MALELPPRLTAGPVESVRNVNAPDLPHGRLRGVRRPPWPTSARCR
ncbi:hypothetical protein KBX37_12600 [Micromonospora sp. U56]|nr:hypothetical protein [Micromonospora sp. U56]MBQ0893926.1 hypothetical protein [Micromonospora sp. U56]